MKFKSKITEREKKGLYDCKSETTVFTASQLLRMSREHNKKRLRQKLNAASATVPLPALNSLPLAEHHMFWFTFFLRDFIIQIER